MKKIENVNSSLVVCSLGDGAITEGEVSEAIHMAVLKQFPILYLIQDNGWDISANSTEIRNSDIGSYFAGFGSIEVVRIPGNDFIKSYLAVQKVINTMRKERRPFMIHADVPLLNHHTSGVRMEWYRDDLEDHFKKDPHPILQKQLMDSGFKKSDLNKLEKILK